MTLRRAREPVPNCFVEPALATLRTKPSIGDVLSEVDQAMVEVPRSSCAPLPAEAATS